MLNDDAAKVLIASSSAFIRILLTTTLRRIGFDVVGSARNVREIMSKFDELHPNILILDAELDEGSDCISVVRSISERSDATAIILIFGSSENNAEEAAIAVKTGVIGFLRKPLTEGEIKMRINNLKPLSAVADGVESVKSR